MNENEIMNNEEEINEAVNNEAEETTEGMGIVPIVGAAIVGTLLVRKAVTKVAAPLKTRLTSKWENRHRKKAKDEEEEIIIEQENTDTE